ncbi:glycerol dehydrogenase [uncultured Thalassospira sp.]|uniref:glycerol dehydrogenase n=1 Tax=uncultured Thalassospira sp. TaxID=404382 RepID=UPI0030D85995|tara:strand:+ start:9371 stop:10468 length:1098 start_codon:yes stop_codon:yes gene_type:complete
MFSMGFPRIYRQGGGILNEIGQHVGVFGSKPLIVVDDLVRGLYGDQLTAALAAENIVPVFASFAGECTASAIEKASIQAREAGCDAVIGLGGGKAIDTAKAVKIETGLPVIVIPTIASNDSPTSRLAIVYTDAGKFVGPRIMDMNPDAVLVDTDVIVRAPVRFFVSGIADALVTKFEADQCVASGGRNFFGGLPTEAAMCLSSHCYQIVRQYGKQAVEDVKVQKTSLSVEKIVEANTLLSGLGFEGCGVAAAHAIGLAIGDLPGVSGILHGEEVAVGLIAQFMLEKREKAFMDDILAFYDDLGLPASLLDIMDDLPNSESLHRLATFVVRDNSRIHNMAMPVNTENVVEALTAAVDLVVNWRNSK